MSGISSVNDRLQDAVADDSYDGYIIGTVMDNKDPEGIARIKVQVTNVMDANQGPIPWCLPSKHSPFGQGSGYGVYGSPAVGSPVRIRFQNGDPNYPVYEADEYLKTHANAKFKDPKTWGYKDPGGSELWVNYETGAWEWTHQSGCYVKYDAQGNLTTKTVRDTKDEVGNNLTITVVGDTLIKSGGQITLDAPAVVATGNLTVGTGWTGSFGTSTGQTVTVQDGIVINVE